MANSNVLEISDVRPRQLEKAELFLGRMQPPHNGHAQIIKRMHNGIVAIVKGSTTSNDKAKNPLPFDIQERLIHQFAPSVKVIEVQTGFVPIICNNLRQQGKEVQKVYAGPDRIDAYKRQVERVNALLPANKKFNITFAETPRVTSATIVRDAIKSGNEAAYKKNVPQAMWQDYRLLKQYIHEAELKSFGTFLDEDGEAAVNVTGANATYDSPIGSKPPEDEDDIDEADVDDSGDNEDLGADVGNRPLAEKYEDQYIPNLDQSARKNRACMPKISDPMKLMYDLRGKGINHSVSVMDPNDLKPGQRNFDLSKVYDMQGAPMQPEVMQSPIIVTKDNYIVDGHHRWMAAINNRMDSILTRKVDIDFPSMIQLLKDLGYPQNRDVEK